MVVCSLNDEIRSTVVAEEVRTGSIRMDFLEEGRVSESVRTRVSAESVR
jgi:hypothetical protein